MGTEYSFRLRRRLEVRPGFVALVCASAYFGSEQLLSAFLLAAILHEGGHLVALRGLGKRLGGVRLSALGAELFLAPGETTSFCQDLVLSLSGPAANLAAAALLAVVGGSPLLLGADLLLGGFNLLPVLPLDGGGALYALLSLRLPPERVQRRLLSFSRTAAVLVTGAGAALLARPGGQPWLALVGVWLALAAFSPA